MPADIDSMLNNQLKNKSLPWTMNKLRDKDSRLEACLTNRGSGSGGNMGGGLRKTKIRVGLSQSEHGSMSTDANRRTNCRERSSTKPGDDGIDTSPILTQQASKSCLRKSRSSGSMGRNISFGKTDHVLHIEHIDDMPVSQVNAIWFKREESNKIRKDAIRLVKNVNAGIDINPDEFRGLERQTRMVKQLKDSQREQMLDIIMGLQEFQWEKGSDLTNAIATMAQEHSKMATLEAQEMALHDSIDSLDYLHSSSD